MFTESSMQKRYLEFVIQNVKEVKNYRLYKPGNISKLCALSFSNKEPMGKRSVLSTAMSWLCTAQDITQCGGVAAGYSFRNGWEPAYPETTGYIIETFYDYADYSGDASFRKRANKMAKWLVSIQMPSGGFQGGPANIAPKPVVFNTGMILFGLLKAYEQEKDNRYLDAARKAGDWLVKTQDEDGSWRRHTYKERPHVYKTRVAWALLELWQATSEPRYAEAARKNLNWALVQQQDDGFFEYMSFIGETPYLHTIAYTIRGLLESGVILNEEKYIDAAFKPADRLFRFYELKKKLPGQFEKSWRPVGNYACLTGCAQMSIIWQRLYQILGDARYLNAALKMNDFLTQSQVHSPNYPEINGSIMGSKPIWGGYMSYYFPNWAAKFYVDALLFESHIYDELESGIK